MLPVGNSETDFVNAVFNTELLELSNADTTNNVNDPCGRSEPLLGTTQRRSRTMSDTDAWLTSGLPAGAVTLYSNGLGGSTVLAFQHGRGQVIMLGWDWYNAVPNGTQDGGWLQVLNSAISRTNNLPTGNVINGGDADDIVSTSQTVLGQPLATAFDDILTLGDGNDEADGAGGDDWMSGGAGKDKLTGGDGDDVLGGGAAKDKLNGGDGVDDFLFDVKLKKAGVDKLDFESGVDHLVLSKSVFKKLDLGVVSKKELDKYFDVSDSGKITYDAGDDSFRLRQDRRQRATERRGGPHRHSLTHAGLRPRGQTPSRSTSRLIVERLPMVARCSARNVSQALRPSSRSILRKVHSALSFDE